MKIACEFFGSALLLAAVVGSGIMGERLAAGNEAVALLANTTATAAALYVLIATLAPRGSAHFNPLVTLASRVDGSLSNGLVAGMVVAQLLGAASGVALAHAMFDLELVQLGAKPRDGFGLALGEFVATAGLLVVVRTAPDAGAAAVRVALWIAAAYWFTSSTSFANPAVTLARALTASFAGIAPASVWPFLLAQLAGAAAGVLAARAIGRASR